MAEGGDLRIVAVSFIAHERMLGIEFVPSVIDADIVECAVEKFASI